MLHFFYQLKAGVLNDLDNEKYKTGILMQKRS